MTKGSKYYSINGRMTKAARALKISGLENEIAEYRNAMDAVDNLCLTKNDYDIITDILNKYISKREAQISELRAAASPARKKESL